MQLFRGALCDNRKPYTDPTPRRRCKAGAEIVKAARQPAFGERLKVLGIEIIAGGRRELDDFRTKERKRLTEIVKANGISIKR